MQNDDLVAQKFMGYVLSLMGDLTVLYRIKILRKAV